VTRGEFEDHRPIFAVENGCLKRKSCNKLVLYCSFSFSSAYEICGCIGNGKVSSDRRGLIVALGLVHRIHIAIGQISFVECNQGIAGRSDILRALCSIPYRGQLDVYRVARVTIDCGIATSRSDCVPRSLDWALSCCNKSMPKIHCSITWAGIALRVSSLRAGNKVCFACTCISLFVRRRFKECAAQPLLPVLPFGHVHGCRVCLQPRPLWTLSGMIRSRSEQIEPQARMSAVCTSSVSQLR
jgi:hypothetical protein